MSGIVAKEECMEFYNAFKLQRSKKGTKSRFVIYRIIDDKEIDISVKGEWDATWDDFVDKLEEKDAKGKKQGGYGIFDFDAETADGRTLAKLVFIAYTPDDSPVRNKMLYGSTRESFKGELGSGLAVVIQASSISDLDEDKVREKVISTK